MFNSIRPTGLTIASSAQFGMGLFKWGKKEESEDPEIVKAREEAAFIARSGERLKTTAEYLGKTAETPEAEQRAAQLREEAEEMRKNAKARHDELS